MTASEYKAARKALGLSQAELAEKLGVSRRTIIAREKGAPISDEAVMAIQALVAEMKEKYPSVGAK